MEEETMMEEREELMVPPTGGNPSLRTAHFLKPTVSPPQNHPAFPLSLKNATTIPESAEELLTVAYMGWRAPQKGWKKWVDRLRPFYGHLWKKAGIFDAITTSTYSILKINRPGIKRGSISGKDLILKLAGKWCPETNTFMFSWGEATITLEDVMILGGLPVLGGSAISPVKTDEFLALEKKLENARLSINRRTGQIARENTWLERFAGIGGKKLEHEAFLVLWLSRYVFPGTYGQIAKNLFLIAINLSRGNPIALAPAVLASIYSDLGLLKNELLDLSNVDETSNFDGKRKNHSLCSPLGLVQIWVWERFPSLRPEPNPIEEGEPRLARWRDLKPLEEVGNIREVLDSAGEYFLWRPYTQKLRNWSYEKFYKENEQFIMVGPDMDFEMETLVRCWRSAELVGIDSIEHYLPHRVGMQFGFDQDLPGFLKRLSDRTPEFAWRHYNRPVGDAKLYIPARLFESDVTKRYQEEWRALFKLGNKNSPGSDDNDELTATVVENDVLENVSPMKRNKIAPGNDVLPELLLEQKMTDDNALFSVQKDDPTATNDDLNPSKSDEENDGNSPEKSQTENASPMKGNEIAPGNDALPKLLPEQQMSANNANGDLNPSNLGGSPEKSRTENASPVKGNENAPGNDALPELLQEQQMSANNTNADLNPSNLGGSPEKSPTENASPIKQSEVDKSSKLPGLTNGVEELDARITNLEKIIAHLNRKSRKKNVLEGQKKN